MRVRDPSGRVRFHSDRLLGRIEYLRRALEIPTDDFLDVVRMTDQEYVDCQQKIRQLPIHAVLGICEQFHVSIDALIEGKIDFNTLQEHYRGNLSYFPEKYKVAAFSKQRTVLNYVNYLERFHGLRKKELALRELQLTEFSLLDPSHDVNLRMVTDMTDAVMRLGLRTEEIQAIGSYSLTAYKGTTLGNELKKSKTPVEAYDRLFHQVLSFLEKNCHYQLIKFKDHRCMIRVTSRNEVAKGLGVRHLGSIGLCAYKAGLFASVPGYLDLPFATINEVKCVHRGDESCDFEADLSDAYRTLSERSLLRPSARIAAPGQT